MKKTKISKSIVSIHISTISKLLCKLSNLPDLVVHTFNLSTGEAEAGRTQGQSGLHSEVPGQLGQYKVELAQQLRY